MRTGSNPPRLPSPGFPALGIGAGALAVIALLILSVVWMGIYRIDAGHVGIVKRFGNVISVVDPGLHVKIPYADTVEEMEVRERAYSVELAAASQDPLELPITVTVNSVGDAGDQVDPVPFPPDLLTWLGDYVRDNYKPEPKKRIRPRSFMHPKDRAKG